MLKQPHELTSIELQAALENALRARNYPAVASKALARDIVRSAGPVIFKAQVRHYTHADAPKESRS